MKKNPNNLELKRDINIVQKYYDKAYPKYVHDTDLYDVVDFLNLLCCIFLKGNLKDLEFKLNIFAGSNKTEIEYKIKKLNYDELTNYYQESLMIWEILKKYYNEDGTLKDKYKQN
ncbi:MAG: hypothetical protein OSJ63_04735 [Bacilli bacterium]|nr:hypothetical protein [Bacilli bacterium]